MFRDALTTASGGNNVTFHCIVLLILGVRARFIAGVIFQASPDSLMEIQLFNDFLGFLWYGLG